MSNLAVPIGVAVLTCFGIAYGWILHRAVEQAIYKITRSHGVGLVLTIVALWAVRCVLAGYALSRVRLQ